MAEKIKVVVNQAEVKKLLRGEGRYKAVREDFERRIARVAAAAGPGHQTEVDVGPNRLRAACWTATDAAREAEATGLNLTRAIDAARGP